jgi:Sporulation and spore germination
MTRGAPSGIVIAGLVVAAGVAWVLFIGLPRWYKPPASRPTPAANGATDAPTETAHPRIKARLFYLTDDGLRLQPREQEVEFGATTAAQARFLIEAQLQPPPPPLVSAIPPGTTLKELFLTDRGEAYVDLSPEFATNHAGGSLDEILTVYTLVAALTENLPIVNRVQILINGREVDTLAGHVDLRRPLGRTPEWFEAPPPVSVTRHP